MLAIQRLFTTIYEDELMKNFWCNIIEKIVIHFFLLWACAVVSYPTSIKFRETCSVIAWFLLYAGVHYPSNGGRCKIVGKFNLKNSKCNLLDGIKHIFHPGDAFHIIRLVVVTMATGGADESEIAYTLVPPGEWMSHSRRIDSPGRRGRTGCCLRVALF